MSQNLFGLLHTLLDASGAALPGGTVEVFDAGTSTPRQLYSDRALSLTAGFSVTSDAAGRFPERWISDSPAVKLIYRDANGAEITTRDFARDANAQTVLADGAVYPRPIGEHFADRANVRDFILPTDADCQDGFDRAAARCAAVPGTVMYIPGRGNTYRLDGLLAAHSLHIRADDSAIIKLNDAATPTGNRLFLLRFTASDWSVVGGRWDQNRDGQSQSAYNAAGGSAVLSWWAIQAEGVDGAHITGGRFEGRIVNSVDYAIACLYADDVRLNYEAENCGAGGIIKNFRNARVERAHLKGLDNDSWRISPNGLDVKDGQKARVCDVFIDDQSGYNVDGLNQRGDWFAGLTCINVDELTGDGWEINAKEDPAMTKSVGISLLSIRGGGVTNVSSRRYTSAALETGSNRSFKISGEILDGEYQKPSASLWPSERGYGIQDHNNGLNLQRTRVLTPSVDCEIQFRKVTGFLGAGMRTFIGGTKVRNTDFTGNLYGVQRESRNVNESFPGTTTHQQTIDDQFENCKFSYNEGAGFLDNGGVDLLVKASEFDNNGQARNHPTPGTTRGEIVTISAAESAGYLGKDGVVATARTRPYLRGCRTQDNQTDTTCKGSASPAEPRKVWVSAAHRFQKGQRRLLKGCGTAGADLNVCVLKVADDFILIDTDIVTFPTSNKTGTLSTSAKAITGFGSLFTTEIYGRYYLKNGANYRLIDARPTDTTGTLYEAFPANLAGQNVTVVEFAVEEMRSQNYGAVGADAANDATLVLENHSFGVGNVTQNTSPAAPIVVSLAQWATPVRLPIGAALSVNGSSALELNSASNHVMLTFDGAGTERREWQFQVPPGVVGHLRPVIVFTDKNSAAGNVVWRYRYGFIADAGDSSVGGTAVNFPVVAAPAQNIKTTLRGPAFPITADRMMYFALDRDGGNGTDTHANDLGVFDAWLEAC